MKSIQKILNAVLSKEIIDYILIDKEYKIVEYSEGIKQYLDMPVASGDSIFQVLPEFVGVENDIQEIFSNPTSTFILESVYKNELYVNTSIEYYNENRALIFLHNITDITLSQKKLLQYSNESTLINKTLQKILDNQNALLFVTNNEEITYINEQFMEYFKIKKVIDLKRRNLKLYTYVDSKLEGYEALFERVNGKEEYVIINNDTFILQAAYIEDTHKLFTLTKVTQLTHEMQFDSLTGAYKKSYFNTLLEKTIQEEKEAVLVVLDIDDFKNINDTYGHQVGDIALKELVDLINSNIRGHDILARWGGEEFLLLLVGTNVDNAIVKVEKLRALIDEHSFADIEHMTVSFGVAKNEKNDDVHSLTLRADKALYEAKDAGKNRVVFKKL